MQEALGLMGIKGSTKAVVPSVTSVKTHPIKKPEWFGPLATSLLECEPPVVAARYTIGKVLL